MGFKRFSLLLGLRTVLLVLTIGVLAILVNVPGYHATTLALCFLVLAQGLEVFRFVSRTNAELNRFLDAARYADFSQRFELTELGAGFGELGQTFSDILQRLQEIRAGQEEELRHLKALVEHVPVPLISLHADGLITYWNNAARRLIGSANAARLEDLRLFGDDIVDQLNLLKPGEQRLVTIDNFGAEQQLAIAATQLTLAGKRELLISLQNIQSELDIAQLQAWQDLVRVLTHEIMNSITPVASLAKTAVDLVDDARSKVADHPDAVADLNDVTDAVTTVAQRSDGLMQFVGSYRRLTRLPEPDRRQIAISPLFDSIARLAAGDWQEKQITLNIAVEPKELDVSADPDMIEQVLINLLNNAEQALHDCDDREVWLTAGLNRRGRPYMEIADNGPGIPPELARKVFVPFFTTRRDGSGVGLALTRQVMIRHGGSVRLSGREETSSRRRGARFTLTF